MAFTGFGTGARMWEEAYRDRDSSTQSVRECMWSAPTLKLVPEWAGV